jgi:predicted kinase
MNIKPTVTVMAGLPGSGKSTIAKQIKALRVNLDDIRTMMGFTSQSSWTKQKEKVAIEAMLSSVEAAVENGQDVVVDNTHLTARIPGMLRRRIGGRASFKVISLLDTPLDKCIEQDTLRDNPVGEDVIRKMAKNASKWRLTEAYMNVWPQVEVVERVDNVPEAIIVDLDGTLAIHNGRDPYDAENCHLDLVDDAVSTIIWALAEAFDKLGPDFKVFFLSGREGTKSVKAKTLKWLQEKIWVDDYNYELLMREEGDSKRPDFNVKYDLFNENIRGRYNILFAMDDRDQIVRLWREMKIKTLQVGYGNF